MFSSSLKALVAIVFSVMMATSGFAHRPVAWAADPRVAAFLEAGGNLSDLCQGADRHGAVAGESCDVCWQSGAAVLPEPGAVGSLGCTGRPDHVAALPPVRAVAFDRDPGRSVRAPPIA